MLDDGESRAGGLLREGCAGGTAYQSGSVEEFDDGWSEGKSPYARKEDNKEFTEDLSAQADGSKSNFATSYNFSEGSLKVYWNGQLQIEGNTFTVGADLKSFTTTFIPPSTSTLEVVYDRFYKNTPKPFSKGVLLY